MQYQNTRGGLNGEEQLAQVVAYEIGDRSQSSFRRLWEAISTSKLVQVTVSRIECVLLLAHLYLAKLHDWFYICVM